MSVIRVSLYYIFILLMFVNKFCEHDPVSASQSQNLCEHRSRFRSKFKTRRSRVPERHHLNVILILLSVSIEHYEKIYFWVSLWF